MTIDVEERLYLITDRRACRGRDIVAVVEEALKGGVRFLQLREKDLSATEQLSLAKRVRGLAERYGAVMTVNERTDIAVISGADGVHLGSRSISPKDAKSLGPDDFLAGVSTHSIDEVLRAEDNGAGFVTFGPVYHTPSKAAYGGPVGIDALHRVCERTKLRVYALGGVKLDNVKECCEAGAYGVSVISAIIGANDAQESAANFIGQLGQWAKRPE